MTRSLLLAFTALVVVMSGSPLVFGAVIYNGHTYEVTPSLNWANAEAYAVSMGGHLVTINDAEENEFIRTTFLTISGAQEDFWIGYYSPTGPSNDPSTYVWVSGEPVTYTNWRGGQPDLVYDLSVAINYVKNNSGYWDNYPSGWERRGIYEVIPEPGSLAILGGLASLAMLRRRG